MINWSETMSNRVHEVTHRKMENIRTVRQLIKDGVVDVEELRSHVDVARPTMQKYINHIGYKTRNGKVIIK